MQGNFIIRIKGSSFAFMIPAFEICKDGSFKSEALMNKKFNSFGRDMSIGLYTEKWEDPLNKKVRIIYPISQYEIFERTYNHVECALLGIEYYAGTSFDNVVKVINANTFIVDEKLLIQGGREANEGKAGILDSKRTDGVNTILNYKGIRHHEKEIKQYEGDCNTEIELLENCKFKMYKFVKINFYQKTVTNSNVIS